MIHHETVKKTVLQTQIHRVSESPGRKPDADHLEVQAVRKREDGSVAMGKKKDKKTVVFDFDGVIHSYKSGWRGYTCIPDPPVEGIGEELRKLHDAGYEVVVVSSRCEKILGKWAIEDWLDIWGLAVYVDKISKTKPPAIAYIDDRAICFDGNPKGLFEKIKSFNPWYKKE